MDLVTPQGETVPIPDDQVGQAVSSGAFGVPKGASVKVVDTQTGAIGTLSADAAVKAFQAGGVRVATEEEFHKAAVENKYGGLGGAALATGAGVARGASAGLSDVAVTGLAGAFGGDATKAKVASTLSGAREAHPYLSTGAEVGGMLAPIVLSGGSSAAIEGGEGASLLARAGRFLSAPTRLIGEAGEAVGGLAGRAVGSVAGEGLAGRVATKAAQLGAQGMLEGSLYGGGNAASEAALSNTDLTAEKMIAGIKHGAILGGVAGAGLGATSVLAEAAAKKIAQKLEPLLEHATTAEGIGDALKQSAERSAFKASGAGKADYRSVATRLGDDGINRVGRTALEELPGEAGKPFWKMNLQDISDAAEAANSKWGKRIGKVVGDLDEVAAANAAIARPSGQRILDRIEGEVVAKLRANPFQEGVAGQVDSMLESFKSRFGAKPIAAAEAPASLFTGSSKAAKGLEDIGAATEKAKLELPSIGDFAPAKDIAAPVQEQLGFAQLHQIRQGLDDMIYRNEKAGSIAVDEMRKVRGIIEDELEKSGDAAAKQVGGNFLSEYKLSKEKYADTAILKKMSANAITAEGANRFVSPSDYGMGFLGATLHGGVNPAGIAMGFVSGSINHFLRKQGRQIMASGLDRASTLFTAERMATEVDQKISSAIDGFISRPGAKAGGEAPALKYLNGGKADGSKAEQFVKKSEQVRDFAMRPGLAAERLQASLGGIANHAPQLAGTIGMKATQATAYLEAKTPGVGRVGSLQPQFDKLMVSNAEAIKWARHAAVVNDPLSVLDDLQHHRLTFEAVDTLKQTSPELYGQIRSQTMEKVANSKKPLSYAQRIQLGVMFDFPSDPSLQPQFVQSIQQMYKQPANQNASGGKKGGGGGAHVRAQPLTIMKSIATGNQRGMTR